MMIHFWNNGQFETYEKAKKAGALFTCDGVWRGESYAMPCKRFTTPCGPQGFPIRLLMRP